MKRIILFATLAAMLVGCSGWMAAQCAGQLNPGGFDLLSTFSGTQDDLTVNGLGVVNFSGQPLPGNKAGNADTIVCRKEALPSQLPATLDIQIVALLLKGDSTYQGQPVTVYATINKTNGSIPATQLPVLDTLNNSTGTMTVFSGGTFNTNSLNVQADLIVVQRGQPVTATPIFHTPMQADTISASGSTWTTTAPAGYPNSTTFPAGGFYVNNPGGGGLAAAAILTSRAVRGSLYGLGLLLLGIAVMKIRSSLKAGRLSLRPIYLMGLAAMAWFVAWRSSQLTFPTIAHAAAVTTCAPHTVSAWIQEGGTVVLHKFVSAVCSTVQTASTSLQ
ncbi:MAG TPA: hypothetical protein VHA33_25660 [Candidatus Angelobacter sp.]|nr:hypothetical protein [Candidatus Angelobacter sp.]